VSIGRRSAVVRVEWMMAAILLLLVGCGEENRMESRTEPGDVPDQILEDFTTSQTDSGKVSWTLTAPEARVYSSRNLVVAERPHIDFYEEDGTRSSVLDALEGTVFRETGDMEARKNVVLTTNEDYVLATESLRWNQETEKIVTDEFVRITKGENVYTGYGLVCDQRLDVFEIKRDLRAYIREEDGDLIGKETP
jgi:LPS export ABC transporter protein LptC